MKYIRLTAICFAAAGVLYAQEGPNRINVPLTDPGRPVQLRVMLMTGGITVKAGAVKDLTVEYSGAAVRKRDRGIPREAEGLKRLDLNAGSDLAIDEANNVVTINSHHGRGSDLVITVPVNTSVNLRTMNNGELLVEGLNGELAANNMNGKVIMRNVSGTVLANSMNGDVTVSMDRVDGNKPNSFSTMNGNIDVTLPPDVKARLKMKANNGEVFSDFDIQRDTAPNKPVIEEGKGRYRVRFDQATLGTINGGGPEWQFSTFNGQIMIRKKK